jgi:hypothetical protein
MNSFVRLYETSAVVLIRWNCMPDAHAVSLAAMRSASMIVVTFVDSHPCRDETASRVGHPDVRVGAKRCWSKGPHAFNSERWDRIPEPSFAADFERIY